MSKNAKIFTYPLTEPLDLLAARAGELARRKDMKFTSHGLDGEFSGMGVEGRYRVDGSELIVTVDKKPRLVPWQMIESRLEGFFTGSG
ncbi:MAG: hypothetical protein CSB33_01345 [Desulfobacterales bacterium]|nr:MAG: hypothetical protein CSB33_01345 [Desulfobacterales bacterium]